MFEQSIITLLHRMYYSDGHYNKVVQRAAGRVPITGKREANILLSVQTSFRNADRTNFYEDFTNRIRKVGLGRFLPIQI